MLIVRRSCRHSNGPLAGFVAHKAPFDPLDQHCAEHTAEEGFWPEGSGKHSLEEIGHRIHICHNEKDCRGHIDHSHHRHHGIGGLSDFLDASKSQDGCKEQDNSRRPIIEEGFGRDFCSRDHGTDGPYRRDHIIPLGGQASQGIENVQQGKEDPHIPAASEQGPSIEGQPAHERPLAFFFEKLGHGPFHKGGSHAKKSRDPHPEQSSRSSYRNGTGHP